MYWKHSYKLLFSCVWIQSDIIIRKKKFVQRESYSKEIQKGIFNIYGFVRFVDEIVDSFHDFDKEKLLDSFEKEYKEIQSNVADYWLASTKEDKLKFYCRFKTAIAIFKLKKKIGVVDFDATTEVPKFGMPKSGAIIMQEYLHSLSIIDKVINMHTTEILEDILNGEQNGR